MSLIAEFDAMLAEPSFRVEVEIADPYAERRAMEADAGEAAIFMYSTYIRHVDNPDAERTDALYAEPAKVAEDLILSLMCMCERDGVSFPKLFAAAAKRHCLLSFPTPEGEDQAERDRRN